MKHTFLTLALCCICTFLPAQSLLKDINKTGSSYPFALTPISEKEMLFFAEDSVHGVGLWKTNGTENGTQFIKTAPFQELIRFSPKIIKGKMYYLWGTYNGSNDHFVELHESDGTSEGTKVIWQSSLYPAYSSDDQYVNTNTHLFFALKNTQMQFLFSFDGTQVQLIDSFTTISHFQANEKKSYFYTSKNNVISVFESDGTKEGTKSIYEFPLLNSFYYPFYRLLKEELWLIQALSDSTITRINLNTREVTDIPTPKPRSIIHFQATNKGIIGSNSENIVAFEEQTGQFKTLFTVPDGLRIKLPVYGKNKMYFVTETPAHKIDLYVTDLNSFEIQLVAKIDTTNGSPIPEPISFPLTVINDIAYFRGPCNGVEWWQSDGTKEGTFCLKDIYEGESSGCFPLMEIDFVNN
ncbi:MAG: hypothetical protein ACKVTZ_08000, partial [Bacteroidia bacterium]